MVLGWRHHRSQLPVALFALGILALFASRGLEVTSGHVVAAAVSVLAGTLLVAGHFLNLGAARRCQRACCA